MQVQSHQSDARRRRPSLNFESLELRMLLTTTLGQAFTVVDNIPASPIGAVNYLQPTHYAAVSIDHDLLATQLQQAPREFTLAANQPLTLTIPNPEGTGSTFEIVEAPIMAPELAAKFPQIKTYRGIGVDDPAATIRLDMTQHGFHAQVLGPQGAFYVDPYYHLDTSAYVSYYVADAGVTPDVEAVRANLPERLFDRNGQEIDLSSEASMTSSRFTSDVHHDHNHAHGHDHHGHSHAHHADHGHSHGLATFTTEGSAPDFTATGEFLRTFRLANAATAEYTNFHGGTVADGQAAIVTAINRVTGIYEIDFSVRLELIANNDQIVYDSNPDPYTNNNAFTMLSQNQNNLDNVIGDANYDIGHVFSRGGGGVAGLGVVGFSGQKARGVSGLGSPIGDPFSVDYVAHEMGHQFDALHTFNGCGGGSGASGQEPGSGSTIMAYAGICGADNLQSNSDPYFHYFSLQEVTNFVENIIPGVGVNTATGNTPPVADAGSNYTIPTETPFKLTGSATDVDAGDVLTYTWEQADSGPSRSLSQPDNGQSPLFRSWQGTTDPTRYLPRLNELLNNTTPVGERYATLPRTMDWRLTVRDNALNGGGHDIDAMVVNVVNTGAPFRVTAPNTGGVSWTGNTSETITWDVAGTDGGSINTPNVNILLSTDGGFTYPITLASGVPNDGSQDITVPNLDTNQARIMVEGDGNIFFDLSNANFAIMTGGVAGDFNGDGLLDCFDIDELTNAVAAGSSNLLYDLNVDGNVDFDDVEEWVVNIKGTLMADANLDFTVDAIDFTIWNDSKFTGGTAWCSGDFDANGITDAVDFTIWNDNKFQSAVIAAVSHDHDHGHDHHHGQNVTAKDHAHDQPCMCDDCCAQAEVASLAIIATNEDISAAEQSYIPADVMAAASDPLTAHATADAALAERVAIRPQAQLTLQSVSRGVDEQGSDRQDQIQRIFSDWA